MTSVGGSGPSTLDWSAGKKRDPSKESSSYRIYYLMVQKAKVIGLVKLLAVTLKQ
jgi:hypothetical protein